MRKILFILLAISHHAWGATCPNGYISINTSSNISVAPQCTQNQLNIGTLQTDCTDFTTQCIPDLSCNAGITHLKTSTGISISLYKQPYTNPSIHILYNNTQCYIPLVPGTQPNSLHIQYESATYHSTDLALCANISPTSVPSTTPPGINTINWYATINNTTVTGISHCSDLAGNIGTTQQSISVSTTVTNNIQCWCRLVYPTASNWTYATTYASNTNCDTYCVAICTTLFGTDTNFRDAIFNTISTI